MTYSQCEQHLKQKLQSIYDAGEAASVSDWLLEEYSGHNRHQRRLHASDIIPLPVLQHLETAMAALLQHKPLQYVLGYTYFYGLKFIVNENVLIPRPETEELVDWIVSDCKNNFEKISILDVGTGSGCIPVSIKNKLPEATVRAIDISDTALQIAKQNALNNNTNVAFSQIDFLDKSLWNDFPKNEIIVSNPPYIPLKEKAVMDKNVTAWEPDTALFVPDNSPLLFYKNLALFGKINLQAAGAIYMETHKDYAKETASLFTDAGYSATLKKDMHGNDRMIKAERNW